tara:strand:- start:81283 stop:82149 length:867 start_codon:yes stop_codon:yes gene_type:complete
MGKVFSLLAGAKNWVMGLSKVALGGTAAVVADQTLLDGSVTKAVTEGAGKGAEGILGTWNRYVNTGMNNIEALDRNLAEQSTSMGWFNTINGWFAGLCDFLGFEQGAEFFKDRMVKTTQEIFDHIDDQRQMLDEHGNVRETRFDNSPEGPAATSTSPAIDAGEVTLGSAFGSAAYGIEEGVVSIGTGITSLVAGGYEALTTDKGLGESIVSSFNAQQGYVMSKLDNLHGKPNMDTDLEIGLNFTGKLASWLVPVGLAAKGTGSIVSGLANLAPKALPEVQPTLGLALK